MLLLGFHAFSTFSQVKETINNEGNLYARALSACLSKEAEEFGRLELQPRSNFANRVVEQNNFLTDKLPTKFGDIRVEYLDADALRERYQKTRQQIQILSLRPMKNKGATLKISIADYWFSYSKNSYNYALEGGCNVDFKFDAVQENFVIAKLDLWGV